MPTIVRVRQDRATREWRWECKACSSYPQTGGGATSQPEAQAAALAHVAELGHQVCRCDEPGADWSRCESDNCTMHDLLIGAWLTPRTSAEVAALYATETKENR